VGLEGKVDEVAVFDRPLAAVEVGRMYAATGRPAAAPPPDEADGPAEAAAPPVISDQPPLPPEQAREHLVQRRGVAAEVEAAERLVGIEDAAVRLRRELEQALRGREPPRRRRQYRR
jgi:hypothetical protein